MGLDITAYKCLNPTEGVEDPFMYDGDNFNPASMAESEKYWPGYAEGLDPHMAYSFEDSFDFRAGGYFGYTHNFRFPLFDLIGAERPVLSLGGGAWVVPKGPFHELLNFSDCEGIIGHKVCAKLAQDFANWQERADIHSQGLRDNEYFINTYNAFRKAFEMAADNGAVSFH